MKTKSSTRVASLTFLLAFASLGALAACSSSDASDPDAPSATALAAAPEEPSVIESAPSAPYVLITQAASGYVLTTLNSGATRSVPTLDLSAAGVDAIATASALASAGTVAARGTVRADDTFVATALYRALPHVGPKSPGAYYVAHTGPHVDSATEVNVGRTRILHRVDLEGAAEPFTDQAWMTARILEGDAIVAGSLAAGVLHASAVFVRLPEVVACAHPGAACELGEVTTYARDANRCLVPTGCSRRTMCPLYVPECATGYVRSTWPGARGCPAFACDPAFDPAP